MERQRRHRLLAIVGLALRTFTVPKHDVVAHTLLFVEGSLPREPDIARGSPLVQVERGLLDLPVAEVTLDQLPGDRRNQPGVHLMTSERPPHVEILEIGLEVIAGGEVPGRVGLEAQAGVGVLGDLHVEGQVGAAEPETVLVLDHGVVMRSDPIGIAEEVAANLGGGVSPFHA
jgi:hypothetical protein